MAIDTRVTRTAPAPVGTAAPPGLLEQVHWGAIFAGALSALGILIVLNLIGLAIGLYVLDPAAQDSDVGAATTTAGVWWALSALAALFAGGWVAGRLAGVPVRMTAALHGVVVWALAVIAAVWLVSSTVRSAFGGAASILSNAGQAAGAVAPQNVGLPDMAVEPALNFVENDLAQEIRGIPAGANLSPQAVQSAASQVVAVVVDPAERQELRDAAAALIRDLVVSPANARQDFNTRIGSVFGPDGLVDQGDRAQAATVLAQQLNISQAQARQTIDVWANRLSQAGPRLEAELTELQATLGSAAGEAADAVAGSALWTAIGLILALAAAVLGGVAGRPQELYVAAEPTTHQPVV